MNLLATLWSPALDPLGKSSIIAVLIDSLAWVVVDLPLLRRLRPLSIYGSLFLILILLWVSDAPTMAYFPFMLLSSKRYFPNCDDYLGNHVLMAIGLVIAFRAFQTKDKAGVAVLTLFGLMTLLAFVQMLILRFG